MQTLLWSVAVAGNALIHLRVAVLDVQDTVDRVKAGQREDLPGTPSWSNPSGFFYVFVRTLASPLTTAAIVTKFLLFPRGIKSKFAKEQAAKAAAKLVKEQEQRTLLQLKEQEAFIRAWAPGEVVLAPPKPAHLTLGWDATADAFDAAAKHVAATKGQPWSPAPPKKRIKATTPNKATEFSA